MSSQIISTAEKTVSMHASTHPADHLAEASDKTCLPTDSAADSGNGSGGALSALDWLARRARAVKHRRPSQLDWQTGQKRRKEDLLRERPLIEDFSNAQSLRRTLWPGLGTGNRQAAILTVDRLTRPSRS